MKKWIAILALIAVIAGMCIAHAAFTEDPDTVLLARAIYALARGENYETKLAIGTVAMNRVDSPCFENTLNGVLNQQHQFPIGQRYDAESLAAARDVVSGRRVLSAQALYYQSDAAAYVRSDAPIQTVGGFSFYEGDSVIL